MIFGINNWNRLRSFRLLINNINLPYLLPYWNHLVSWTHLHHLSLLRHWLSHLLLICNLLLLLHLRRLHSLNINWLLSLHLLRVHSLSLHWLLSFHLSLRLHHLHLWLPIRIIHLNRLSLRRPIHLSRISIICIHLIWLFTLNRLSLRWILLILLFPRMNWCWHI